MISLGYSLLFYHNGRIKLMRYKYDKLYDNHVWSCNWFTFVKNSHYTSKERSFDLLKQWIYDDVLKKRKNITQ